MFLGEFLQGPNGRDADRQSYPREPAACSHDRGPAPPAVLAPGTAPPVGIPRVAVFPCVARRQGTLQTDGAGSGLGGSPTVDGYVNFQHLLRAPGKNAF